MTTHNIDYYIFFNLTRFFSDGSQEAPRAPWLSGKMLGSQAGGPGSIAAGASKRVGLVAI